MLIFIVFWRTTSIFPIACATHSLRLSLTSFAQNHVCTAGELNLPEGSARVSQQKPIASSRTLLAISGKSAEILKYRKLLRCVGGGLGLMAPGGGAAMGPSQDLLTHRISFTVRKPRRTGGDAH